MRFSQMVKLSLTNSFSVLNHQEMRRTAASGLHLLSLLLVLGVMNSAPAVATAELDSGSTVDNSEQQNTGTANTADSAPSITDRPIELYQPTPPPPLERPVTLYSSKSAPLNVAPRRVEDAHHGATFTFSVPLMVAGSKVPHVPSDIPDPPSNILLPPPSGSGQALTPLAWRSLALALPAQKTDSTHLKAVIKMPAPKCLESALQECSSLGLAIRDQALPAGQLLFSLDNEATSRRSSLLIVIVPVDNTTSEMHVKILARGASSFMPLVNQLIGTMSARGQQTNLL